MTDPAAKELTIADLPVPTTQEATDHLERAKLRAAIALDHAVFELHKRVVTPGMTTAQLLSASEHLHKVSGAAAKQEAKDTGPGFSITINIPQVGNTHAQQVVLTREDDPVGQLPNTPFVFAFPVSNDLSAEVEVE